jgi:7-cyano-7-deazaguanine synthase
MRPFVTVIVLLSGGQDSTTCLFWAAEHLQADRIVALSIHYGQRHAVELEAAEKVLEVFSRHHPKVEVIREVVEVGPILAGTSPLTDHARKVETYAGVEALPGGLEATFVPARNVLFLTLAGNRAVVHEAKAIVTGTAQEDFGGYPDCRAGFIDRMEGALNAGLFLHDGEGLRIWTPLMFLTKAETVKLAASLPGCWEALGFSHTCYQGVVPPCGSCHACLLRGKGFRAEEVEDPLVSRMKEEGRLDPSWTYPE